MKKKALQNTKPNADSRRDFLKTLGTLAAAGAVGGTGAAFAGAKETTEVAHNQNSKATWVNILQTTDVHCQLHPHDELFWENNQPVFRKSGGYAHLASYFKQERKAQENTFILDTGDMFQGSELSFKTTGKALVPILNQLNYDLYIPGNWEVIYGKQNMQHLMGALDAPKICTNMYHQVAENQKGELIFQPYHIWRVAGVKIGFLAYTDPLVPIRQSPAYSKGILYTKPEENLKHYINHLKTFEGCQYIILLSHLGLSQQIALSNMPECEGVNIIMGGDTHERVRKPIVGKYAKVVEPGAFGSFVGKLMLKVENGIISEEKYELVEIDSRKIKADKETQKVISNNEKPFEENINKIVGYSTLPLYRYFVVENTIDTMVLDALAWKLPNVDIVLSNGFRFCPPRSTPDQTGNIPITEGYIFDMLPVDANLKIGEVTGNQLLNWLEKELNNVFSKDASKRFGGWVVKFKGMQVKFKAYEEMGKRVQEVMVKGMPLDPTKTYSIAACERDGDPEDMVCRIKNVKNPRTELSTLHQTMREYLKANTPISPKPEGNALVLDAPQTLLTQVFGVDYEFR